MTGNVQLYLTDVGRILHRMEARLAGDEGWVKGNAYESSGAKSER